MTNYATWIAALALLVVIVGSLLLGRRFAPATVPLRSPEQFARLVVAEIRLYDPKKVEEASSQSALYRVLKSDIDRARAMFLARFPNDEQAFFTALVTVLAQGDPARLGSEYPYPRKNLPARSSV